MIHFFEITYTLNIYLLKRENKMSNEGKTAGNEKPVNKLRQSTEAYIKYLNIKKYKHIYVNTNTEDIDKKIYILENALKLLQTEAWSDNKKVNYCSELLTRQTNQAILLNTIDTQESFFLKAIIVTLAGILGLGIGGFLAYRVLFDKEENHTKNLPQPTPLIEETKGIDRLLEAMTDDLDEAEYLYDSILDEISGEVKKTKLTNHLVKLYEFKQKPLDELVSINEKIKALKFTDNPQLTILKECLEQAIAPSIQKHTLINAMSPEGDKTLGEAIIRAMTDEQNEFMEIFKAVINEVRTAASLADDSGAEDLMPAIVTYLEKLYQFKNKNQDELELLTTTIEALDYTLDETGEPACCFNTLRVGLTQALREAKDELILSEQPSSSGP